MPTEDYLYSAFGLVLSLPVPSKALRAVPKGALPDVTVRYGPVPKVLVGATIETQLPELGWQMALDVEGRVHWTTTHARYLIEGGVSVLIDPLDRSGSIKGGARFAIYHGLPAILVQRGILALHANTVATAHHAVTLAGDSGVGKSTLTAALLARGQMLVSDDISAFSLQPDARVHVLPGFPLYKLLGATHARFDPPAEAVWHVPGPRRKVAVRTPVGAFAKNGAEFKAIVVLAEPSGEDLTITPITGSAKLALLFDHAYLTPLVELRAHTLSALPRLLQDVPVYQVKRPADRWTVDELADAIIALTEG